jgi:hypothetical protein
LMDRILEESADRYTAAQQEGQLLISRRWNHLQPETRQVLAESGFYSVRGERLPNEDASSGRPQDDCERLEYAIGVLKQCTASVLPLRADKGAPIPRATLDQEVLTSCEELLFVPLWHDPVFLQLAMAAALINQEATALTLAGLGKSPSAALSCIGRLFQLGLILLMPAALALGLAAASGRDAASAAFAFYLLGAGILAAISVSKPSAESVDANTRDYVAWSRFRLTRAAGVTGAGALIQLEKIALGGTAVPSVLLDVAAALQVRMTAATSPRG